MKKIIIVILLLFLTGCPKDIIKNEVSLDYEKYYGYLIIPSIDMTYGFFNIGNSLNDVDKNVTFIDSGIPNTYILAAHSGTGHLAYFNDLKYIKNKDKIYLKFADKALEYEVKNIKSVKKNGKIKIKKEENKLILTTCDQIVKGNQLIIEAKLKIDSGT